MYLIYRLTIALDFVGIDSKTARLLMIVAKDDVDQRISFTKSLITKFPVIDVHSQLRDAHLYIFKRWVLDLISERKTIASIKDDLLPLLVKCQAYTGDVPLREFKERSICRVPNFYSGFIARA